MFRQNVEREKKNRRLGTIKVSENSARGLGPDYLDGFLFIFVDRFTLDTQITHVHTTTSATTTTTDGII